MSDIEVRQVRESEHRATIELFGQAIHRPPLTDAVWAGVAGSFEQGRTLGAFAGGRMVGTALAWSSDLVVPGGRRVPMAAVTRVAVRTDFRRRGTLRELMRAQLADFAARGEPLAALRASEPGIYGRFGYGEATRTATLTLRSADVALRPEVPDEGEVRLLDSAPLAAALEISPLLSDIHARVGRGRVGTIARPAEWWPTSYDVMYRLGEGLSVAVHRGSGGDDGFVAYRVTRPGHGHESVLEVQDLVAATPAVAAALWRFVLGVDLVDTVRALFRPVDEPVAAMLVDPRAVTKAVTHGDLWVRLVDVPAALAARCYGAGSVVVEVEDAFLPGNSGRYRVGADGAVRTGDAPELAMDVDVLGMLYLGGWAPSVLAGIGRVRELVPGAAERADTVFTVPVKPWSGTRY
ncbi:GNAT family N-acetyltransferase [Actinokineospora enzanensis]|uniref:GNAT family N-acetyltransferase n=1 Tax=Actinokineospora enzanensis TaxID=155975 RepID=UPI000476BC7D|nr:GNAT family N-acetyltransferase [Actinokineospora enzanensis]